MLINIIYHGLICSILLSTIILLLLLKSPRIFLEGYPDSIRSCVPPKTKLEKRWSLYYGIPFLSVLVLYPLLIGWQLEGLNNDGFMSLVVLIWGILLVFNLFDLLIIDWLLICVITPKFVIIPGTEGNKGYNDYGFHFLAFLKGTIITLVMAFLISFVIITTLRLK